MGYLRSIGILRLLFPASSLALMSYGLYRQEWWAFFGLVLFMTALLITIGSVNAQEQGIGYSPIRPATRSPSAEEFFPKGAIAFFAALIVFFGSVWMGLYALMIYRHSGI